MMIARGVRWRGGRSTDPGPAQIPLLEDLSTEVPSAADDDRDAWLSGALDAIALLSTVQHTVDADDLRAVIAPPPSPSLWGRAWSAAHRLGLIRRTGGYRASRTASRRSGANAVWRAAGGDR